MHIDIHLIPLSISNKVLGHNINDLEYFIKVKPDSSLYA